MKVIYKKSVEDYIHEAHYEAARQGKAIDRIVLTKSEMSAFKRYVDKYMCPPQPSGNYVYYGHKIVEEGK